MTELKLKTELPVWWYIKNFLVKEQSTIEWHFSCLLFYGQNSVGYMRLMGNLCCVK